MSLELFVHAGRVDLILVELQRARSVATRRYLLDALERALLLADPGALSGHLLNDSAIAGADSRLVEKLRDAHRSAPLAHLTLVALHAPPDVGFARGAFIVRAESSGSRPDLQLDEQAAGAVAEALAAVASLAAPHATASDFRLTVAQPRAMQAFRIEGDSLAAAAALSAAALWLHRPVHPGTVVTGSLIGRRVQPVGKLKQKIIGTMASRNDVHRWIVPAGNVAEANAVLSGQEVIGVSDLSDLLEAGLGTASRPPAPRVRVDEARRVFRLGWEGYRWPTQREPLERLVAELPRYRPDLRLEAMTLLGAVHRHLGNTEDSLRCLERAVGEMEDAGESSIPASSLSALYRHHALTFRQMARFEEAKRAADHAVRTADDSRWVEDRLRAHGSAGLVHTSAGNQSAAVSHQQKALALAEARAPEHVTRTLGYLTEALSRNGAPDEATDAYQAGLRGLPLDEHTDEVWLRVHRAAGLSAEGRARDARLELEVSCVKSAIAEGPTPGLLARRYLGIALTKDAASLSRGFGLLGQSPYAYGTDLSFHTAFAAHLNVISELIERLRTSHLDDDALARGRLAMARIPRTKPVRAFLADSSAEIESTLIDPTSDPEQTLTRLDRLVGRAQRIA